MFYSSVSLSKCVFRVNHFQMSQIIDYQTQTKCKYKCYEKMKLAITVVVVSAAGVAVVVVDVVGCCDGVFVKS